MILGTIFLTNAGPKLDYSSGQMIWYDVIVPTHPYIRLTSKDFDDTEDMYHIQFEDKLLSQDWLKINVTEILDARFQWTDIADVVAMQHHLNTAKQVDLLAVL